MSVIESILDAVAALSPTYDSGVDIGCWNIDDIKPNLEAMSCPKRVLMVTGDGISADPMTFVAAPVGEMAALRRYSGELVRYIASYIEQVRQNRAPTSQSHIVSVSAYPGIYEWGGKSYYGVDITLEIEEVISGA